SQPLRLRIYESRRREGKRPIKRRLIRCGSEGHAAAQLNLTAGVHGHSNRTELGRVHKSIRGTEVCVIERVESLTAHLQPKRLSELKFASDREVHQLHAW